MSLLCSSGCPGIQNVGNLLVVMAHKIIVDWDTLSLVKLISKISYDYIKSYCLYYYLVLYCMALQRPVHLNTNWWKIDCIICTNWILYIKPTIIFSYRSLYSFVFITIKYVKLLWLGNMRLLLNHKINKQTNKKQTLK